MRSIRSSSDEEVSPPSSVVALCRAGFEAEAASDLRAVAERSNASLECAVDRGTGFVVGRSTGIDAERWRRAWIALPPIFVRTAMIGTGPYDLDRSDPRGRPDRVSPLIDAIIALAPPPLRSVWVEFADSDEGKRLSALARALEPRLREALRLSPLEDDDPSDPAARIPRRRENGVRRNQRRRDRQSVADGYSAPADAA